MPKETSNPEANWFGFRPVSPDDKTGLVQSVFASVAGNYDLMNDLMSLGMHRLWKNRFVDLINPRPGQTILDVAGGTGDIALRCWEKTRGEADIIVCDLNPAMLAHGRQKAIDRGILPGANEAIRWTTGNAEDLPVPSRSIDSYAIAFGLRNVTRIDKALAEAARVLKPGGHFFCMEFSSGVAPLLKPLYENYCLHLLPWLGQKVAQDREAYQYLAESILRFPVQSELARRMDKAGLERCKWYNLNGGIAVIHSGWRL